MVDVAQEPYRTGQFADHDLDHLHPLSAVMRWLMLCESRIAQIQPGEKKKKKKKGSKTLLYSILENNSWER